MALRQGLFAFRKHSPRCGEAESAAVKIKIKTSCYDFPSHPSARGIWQKGKSFPAAAVDCAHVSVRVESSAEQITRFLNSRLSQNRLSRK